MGSVVVTRVLTCASDPCALWEVITDTDLLNRAGGNAPLHLEPLSDAGAARYLAHTRLGGFAVDWEEQPYEWRRPERFSVRRIHRTGPATDLRMVYVLAPEGLGTRLTLTLTIEPRWPLVSPVIQLQASRGMDRLCEVIRTLDQDLAEHRQSQLCAPPRLAEDALSRAAETLSRRLRPPDRATGEQLVRLVRTGADTDVDRIRPFALARSLGEDRERLLRVCLEAVPAGLLELSWDLICPSCRTASTRLPSLTDIPPEGHCQLCDLSYELDLDRAVEATFRPPTTIREIEAGPYCPGGPARTPHVESQVIVPATGTAALMAPDDPGDYSLFPRGGPAMPVTVRAGAPDRVEVRLTEALPATLLIAPRGQLQIAQAQGQERHVKLERGGWNADAASAHLVSLTPQGRRLFGKDALRPGLPLRVARTALFFSDLSGSTALYSRMGDARAFGLVQDHFALLREIIEAHRGVLVKTIGDAVMAAFDDEPDALAAALACQTRFAAFRDAQPDAATLFLKIGIHAGACYAVNANGILDYFGQSVNIAARLQGLAGPGDLVISAETASRARAAGWLSPAALGAPFQAVLKGLDQPVYAVRVRADAVLPMGTGAA